MAHKVKAGSFADERRGSRHSRGYGAAWDRLRESIRVRAAGLCEPCLAVGLVHEGHQCDHKVSKAEWRRLHGSLAGVDDPSNLQWMHRDCHAAKTIIDRQRAAGADVPPWAPTRMTHPAAEAGTAAGPGAPPRGAPGSPQVGGGEKSAASPFRTDRLGKFSCAGNLGGGVPPEAAGGAV